MLRLGRRRADGGDGRDGRRDRRGRGRGPRPPRSSRSRVVALAQHRRRAGLVLVDAHGDEADHVFVEAELTLELDDRRRRRVDVHQREIGLAVLLDAEGEGFQAPGFDLGDRAAVGGDEGLERFGQRLDLLARSRPGAPDRYARREPWRAFPSSFGSSRAEPFEPVGKARGGSFEGGDTGSRALKPCRVLIGRGLPFSPQRDASTARL